MRTSRFLGTALLAFSLALTGCGSGGTASSSTSAASASMRNQVTIETAADTAGTSDTATAKGFDIQTESQWEPTRFHATWPHSQNTAFNVALDQVVSGGKDGFTSTYDGENYKDSVAIPEYTVTWASLVNDDSVQGVRLISNEFGGSSHARISTTIYGSSSGTDIWQGKDLIDSAKMTDFLKMLDDAAQQQGLRAADDTPLEAESVLRDVSFEQSGDMKVHVAKGDFAGADQNDVMLTLSADAAQQWLSDAGRRVQGAARKVQAPSSSATPSVATSAQPAESTVDCTVEKCIALTFDDGPGPYTNQILDTLEAKGAKATFFTIGRNVSADPATVKREVETGLAVGDHTWSHPVLSSVSAETAKDEISKTAEAIWNATGTTPVAVRPPYGAFAKTTPHEGLPFVLWDIDSEDWKNRNADTTTKNIMSAAHPGGIVLMHDIHPSTAQALPGIIDQLQAQGYQLVTVPELLGGTMEPDGAYYSGNAPSS